MKHDISTALAVLRPKSEFFLEGDEYSDLNWLDSGTTKPTETEINNKIAELNNAEAMKLLREERNRLLNLTDWRASSDLTLSDDWKNYRQALRDMPASASPTLNSDYKLDKSSVTWPTVPS